MRALILTGEGKAFSAGGDLSRFERDWDPREFRHDSHRLTSADQRVERLEKPTVAAINGAATGAGTQLALVCDVRLMAPGARLIYREGRLGIIPVARRRDPAREADRPGAGERRDPRRRGGEPEAAFRVGLVTELADDAWPPRASGYADAGTLPAGLRGGETAAVAGGDVDLESGMVAEGLAQSALIGTPEHKEAVKELRGDDHRTRGQDAAVAEDAFIAPTAVLIGDVTVDAGAIDLVRRRPARRQQRDRHRRGLQRPGQLRHPLRADLPTVVGPNVTIGHMAMLEGCAIEDGS